MTMHVPAQCTGSFREESAGGVVLDRQCVSLACCSCGTECSFASMIMTWSDEHRCLRCGCCCLPWIRISGSNSGQCLSDSCRCDQVTVNRIPTEHDLVTPGLTILIAPLTHPPTIAIGHARRYIYIYIYLLHYACVNHVSELGGLEVHRAAPLLV